jgi:toxin ParE1/3/4
MDYRVIYSPKALNDLREIVEYVSKDNPQAALRLGTRLADQASSLAVDPCRGARLKHRGVRKLLYQPYLIVYRIDESQRNVEILRFWHTARDQRGMRLQ